LRLEEEVKKRILAKRPSNGTKQSKSQAATTIIYADIFLNIAIFGCYIQDVHRFINQIQVIFTVIIGENVPLNITKWFAK
jgi:hypothetical protein